MEEMINGRSDVDDDDACSEDWFNPDNWRAARAALRHWHLSEKTGITWSRTALVVLWK